MIRLIKWASAIGTALILCCPGNVAAQSGVLDSAEADSLEFLAVFTELKQSYYRSGIKRWPNAAVEGITVEEQHNIDVLDGLAAQFEMEIPDSYWSCGVILMATDELDFYCDPVSMDMSRWYSWNGFLSTAAYFEELGIRRLIRAIQESDDKILTDAYASMLGEAYVHLLSFAAALNDDPTDYKAQILDQVQVDLILAVALDTSFQEFGINSGLNDVWYDPMTAGQGFTVTVFANKGTVFLTWFTYDTDLPVQGSVANLGDAGQRWLTAEGPFEGTRAELAVYSSGGGVFDAALPAPASTAIGTIQLQFNDCHTGSVTYEFPGLDRSGSIPIERAATDNVCNCQDEIYLVP